MKPTFSRKKLVILTIFITLALLCVIFIFSNSLKNSAESTEQSSAVYKFINSVISSLGFSVSHSFVRKLAHVTEFALLGIFSALTSIAVFGDSLHSTKLQSTKKLIPAVLLCISVASVDELLQFGSDGRAPQLSDALLDILGSIIGISAVWALIIICKAIRIKKAKKASL